MALIKGERTRTLPECQGCVKISGKFCAAIHNPEHFYDRYGECFSRNEDPEFWDKHKVQVERYVTRRMG